MVKHQNLTARNNASQERESRLLHLAVGTASSVLAAQSTLILALRVVLSVLRVEQLIRLRQSV